jgi:hydrogenase maturation protein HypF
MTLQGLRIHVRGIVQGVGFRPFVYGLAKRYSLNGWVRNTSAGVDIDVDGSRPGLEAFLHALSAETPALAHIDEITPTWIAPNGYQTFEIRESQPENGQFIPISPDVSICDDCLHELFDPADRRYRYPFINCTNCGPRFTIIKDIPYDRPQTTMADFPMCPDCASEYHDPLDRRFHAQPVACPVCGPQVWLELAPGTEPVSRGDAGLTQARQLLLQGKILAVKGLGGFHLACDATNPQAVAELRRRKLRVDKPFAVMVATADQAAQHCLLSPLERELLERRARPIVILHRRPDSTIAEQVAPGQSTVGMMLPYTPLHYLLFAQPHTNPPVFDMPPLVMTSGNLSEEPICTGNNEARERLAPLTDAFLLHDRDIHVRCDDSVFRIFPSTRTDNQHNHSGSLYPLRRSRGFAPDPVRLDFELLPLLATGAELKNTFCLTRQQYAFLSHHIGDLENLETLASFEQGIEHFERLFRIQPQAIAYDLHPDYLATRYALARAEREGLPAVGVQHHHAHIAACMAENGLDGEQKVIGVAFDGTGYGDDGGIWGGEFLISDHRSYQRAAHLKYVPLPGGDKAVREPWRMALAWLASSGIDWAPDLAPMQYASVTSNRQIPVLDALRRQLQTGLNAPPTSSMGRLFDAAAALAGVRQTVNYEAQAAIELEALADSHEQDFYPFDLKDGIVDPAPAFEALVSDLRRGAGIPLISARFHLGVAEMVRQVCASLQEQTGIAQVALSGGVWQNVLLLNRAVELLHADGFEVYLHRQVPANDGGLALGQAVVANARLKNG